MARLSLRRADPWWDVEGRAVRRDRTHRRVVGGIAFALAIGACGLTAATWARQLEPLVARLLAG